MSLVSTLWTGFLKVFLFAIRCLSLQIELGAMTNHYTGVASEQSHRKQVESGPGRASAQGESSFDHCSLEPSRAVVHVGGAAGSKPGKFAGGPDQGLGWVRWEAGLGTARGRQGEDARSEEMPGQKGNSPRRSAMPGLTTSFSQ